MSIPSPRIINFCVFILCVITIGIVLYMEYVLLLSPCGLCISQRVLVIFCGFVCLIAAIHNPSATTRATYGYVAAAMCVFGSYFAGKQIWLQHLPEDQVPACGPGLSYIYENFPLIEALNFLLLGDGNCAEVQFRFLGLSIPELAMIAFIALFSICIYQARRKDS